MMKGYHDNIQATKDTLTEDGWIRTGDIVSKDQDGYLWVLDRKKELIKYKGFQVPPAELEGLLIEHPAVADAAVIGKADEEFAFWVRSPPVKNQKNGTRLEPGRFGGEDLGPPADARLASQNI